MKILPGFKSMLRDWLFADCKWILRAQVQLEICALRAEYRSSPVAQRVLDELVEVVK